MSSIITDEVFVAYSQCPRKAYLLMHSKEQGQPHEYRQILEQHRLANQNKHIDALRQNGIDVYPYSVENFKKGYEILTRARLTVDELQADYDILMKAGKQIYEPKIFIGTHCIDNIDKLRLSFIGYVLTKIQDHSPTTGHIVTLNGKSFRAKFQQEHKRIIPLLEPLQKWVTSDSPIEPPLILNKNCSTCQFQRQCESKAVLEDNLSRLAGATPKVIRKYERKGIFTVKQLSYLFKPRKRKKRAKSQPPTIHQIELQALAIRTSKIYIQELPTLTRQAVELFLDIESVPDEAFYYLFGIIVCEGETITYQHSWANTDEDEEKAWQAFLTIINQYPEAPIYHYGSYEVRAIAKLARRHKTDVDKITKRLVNIHKQIYGRVYFPVYSNRLKEVSGFVGATWTHPDASGIYSIAWRYKWVDTNEDRYREMLVTYNQEDCHALRLLFLELFKIQQSSNTLLQVDFADQYKEKTTEASREVSSQLKEILKFSYFDYGKKKIHFHSEDETQEIEKTKAETRKLASRKLASRKYHEKAANIRREAKKTVILSPEVVCPVCGHQPLKPTNFQSKRFIVDLVLTKNGIKRTVTNYSGFRAFCSTCNATYAPYDVRKHPTSQMYGHGFGAWVVFQRVALRLPYESIAEAAYEQFRETFNTTQPQRFLRRFAAYYAKTEGAIAESMLKSPFIHVDETKANIQGTNWYVFVFTDGKHVILKLSETRETTIVRELLGQYHGVLISDFYGGYDSIECKQQKCWVHLIGDLNNDIQEYPFDEEYEVFVKEVRDLILPIMKAVQQYGLKKRHLRKFMQQVDDFYARVITDKKYKSDLLCTYQKRFVRYRDSLFTFLEQDGIPWNNNAAERAVRPFARQRDVSKSPFYASVLRDYLVLLEIRQTCRFQSKSFFKFLFSQEIDLEKFGVRKRKN